MSRAIAAKTRWSTAPTPASASATSSGSERSKARPRVSPPSSVATDLAVESSRLVSTTDQPCPAYRCAISLPIPSVPPTISSAGCVIRVPPSGSPSRERTDTNAAAAAAAPGSPATAAARRRGCGSECGAAHAGPRDVAGAEDDGLPSKVASASPSRKKYVSSNGWSCGPAAPSGSYCTMNIVDSCAPGRSRPSSSR